MEQEIYYKGYKIKIRQDEFCESPNEWINEDLFLVYDHRQFNVERKGFEPNDIYNYLELKSKIESSIGLDESQEELEDEIKGYFDYNSKYWIFPVEAYIHSGVSLSLFSGTKQCRWDSSVAGYILAEKDSFKDEYDAIKSAESLIETWNQYLSGEVYGFITEKPTTIYSIEKSLFDKHLKEGTVIKDLEKDFMTEDEWEEIDSCWGYYGEPEKSGLMDEARSVIDNLTKNE